MAWKTARSCPRSRKRCCARDIRKRTSARFSAETFFAYWSSRKRKAKRCRLLNRRTRRREMVRAILCTGACVAAGVVLAGGKETDMVLENARKRVFSSYIVGTRPGTQQRLLGGKHGPCPPRATASVHIS